MNWRIYLLAGGIAPLFFAHSIQAGPVDPIDPIDVTASSTYDPRLAVNTINTNGLDSTTGIQSNDPNTMWLSNGEPSPTITWDLGGEYQINQLQLWNYNENSGNPASFTKRGIATAQVLISNDPTFAHSIQLPLSSFLQASGGNDTGNTYATSFTARFVRFTNTSSFPGADNYTGLSKIRFDGTAVPTALLTPVNATASSYYTPDDRAPIHTVDGSGLNVLGQHSNTPSVSGAGQMWLTEAFDPNPYIQFDLGSDTSFTGIRLWNYNENSGNPDAFLQRGIKTADIEVSDDPTFATFTDLGTETFAEATGTNTYAGGDYAISGKGQFVRFTKLVDYGAADYMGLSEVKFITSPLVLAPEPASAGLLGLGAIGLLAGAVNIELA